VAWFQLKLVGVCLATVNPINIVRTHQRTFTLNLFFAVPTSTSDPRAIEIMAPPSTPQLAFGVQYLPSSVKIPTYGQGTNVFDLHRQLSYRGIRYIRLQWVDYTNTTRYRIIPLESFRKLMSASRPGIGVTKAAFGLVGASLAPGFSGTGEYLYVPDLSSLRPFGVKPSGYMSLMGWFEEKLPSRESAGRRDALKVPLCPRGLLRDVVKYVYLGFANLVVDNRRSQQGQRTRRRISRWSRDRIHSSQVNGSCRARDLCLVVGIPCTALGFSC
jgi:hypothetical protein